MRRPLAKLRYRRLQRRLAGPRLLAALAAARPEVFFVEIGANDGVRDDHLHPLITAHGWRGIMVEPVPHIYARLQENYAGHRGVILENAAIADAEGFRPFFHVAAVEGPEREALPDWYDGIGSFSRETVMGHARKIPGLADRLVEAEVPTLTFGSLLARHGNPRVDLLVVDTEGHDDAVLAGIDLARHRPLLVVYEHFHLPAATRERCRERMEELGYETMEEGFDTWCLDLAGEAELTRAFRRLRPAVPGVTAETEPGA